MRLWLCWGKGNSHDVLLNEHSEFLGRDDKGIAK